MFQSDFTFILEDQNIFEHSKSNSASFREKFCLLRFGDIDSSDMGCEQVEQAF